MRTNNAWVAGVLAFAMPATAEASTGNVVQIFGWFLLFLLFLILMLIPPSYILICGHLGFMRTATWLATVALANLAAVCAVLFLAGDRHGTFLPWILALLPGYMIGFAYKFTIEVPDAPSGKPTGGSLDKHGS